MRTGIADQGEGIQEEYTWCTAHAFNTGDRKYMHILNRSSVYIILYRYMYIKINKYECIPETIIIVIYITKGMFSTLITGTETCISVDIAVMLLNIPFMLSDIVNFFAQYPDRVTMYNESYHTYHAIC